MPDGVGTNSTTLPSHQWHSGHTYIPTYIYFTIKLLPVGNGMRFSPVHFRLRDSIHGHDFFKKIQQLERCYVSHLLKNNKILFNIFF